MALPAFGAAGTYLTGGTRTTSQVPVPSGVTAGQIVEVRLYVESTTTVTAPAGQGFTELTPTPATTGPATVQRIFWKRATGADSGTYDFTHASAFTEGVATRYTGALGAGSPYDTSAGAPTSAQRSSTSPITPAVSLTTQGVERLLVWSATSVSTGAWTPPTAGGTWTERVDTGREITIATRGQNTAGSTGSVTGTGPSDWMTAWLVALLPAAASQTVNPDTVPAPAAPFAPAIDQTSRIYPTPAPAPAVPYPPAVLPGSVSVFPTAVAAPAAPPAPKLVQVIRPTAAPDGSQVYPPAVSVEPRPPLRIDFWATSFDGVLTGPLPHPLSWDLTIVPGEPGAVRIEYPRDGHNFDLLDEGVTRKRDLRIRIRVDGTHTRAFGALLQARDGDQIDEQGTVTFTGRFLTWLLNEAPLPRHPTAEKGEWSFPDATAGEVLHDVMAAVQDVGYLAGAIWNFTATHDSNGQPWAIQTSPRFPPGRSVLQIAQQLRKWGMVEFEVTDAINGTVEFRAYEPTTVGYDHTLTDPPVVLRHGRDLTDAPRRADVTGGATSLLIAGADGVYVEVEDHTAEAERGRKIGAYLSEGNLTTEGSALAYGAIELARRVEGPEELTHQLTFDPDQPAPLRELRTLDWVYTDTGDGTAVGSRERIAQITVSQSRGSDHYQGGVVLRDLIASRDLAQAQLLDGLAGGQIVTGVSTPAPSTDDGKAPGQVLGVGVVSGAYPATDGAGGTRAAVTAIWLPVEDNFDGTTMFDFDHYEPQFRYLDAPLPLGWTALPPVTGESTSWDAVVAGAAIAVRVRAVDRFGRAGAWSDEEAHTTDSDATPPPVPSTPDVQSYLGILTIEWDGLGSAGEAMPPDFDRVDVHVSLTSGFTPSSATYLDSLRAAGTMPTTIGNYGDVYFAKLVSVDKSGNASAPSAQDSATLVQAADGDIGALSIGKLTAGIMSALMTISGIIRTASSGARVELDTAGLRCYSSTGQVLFQFDIPTSALSLLGKFTAGPSTTSGNRISVDPAYTHPGDSAFPTVTLYSASGVLGPARINASDQPTFGTGHTALGLNSGPTTGSSTFEQSTLFLFPQAIRLAVNAGGGGAIESDWRGGALSADDVSVELASAPSGTVVSRVRVGSDVVLSSTGQVYSTTAMGTNSGGFSMKLQNGAAAGVRAYYESGSGTLRFVDNQPGGTWMQLGGPGGAYKTFVIEHKLDASRWLVHVALEAPEALIMQRGTAVLAGGRAVVELPAYFEAHTLVEGRQVQATVVLPDEAPLVEAPAAPEPVVPWARKPDPEPVAVDEVALARPVAASRIRNGRFTLVCPAPDGTEVDWVVTAVRSDGPPVVVEPLRADVDVRGDGPYRWIAGTRTRD